jgi:5-methylcytosine-specific restriction endonuclease McrA
MPDSRIAPSPEAFADFLHGLRLERRQRKAELRAAVAPRQLLSPSEREGVFRKTNGRCHICGGSIDGKWQADHVFSHSAGGAHAADNYLPAHALCNNYRWDYSADEFQSILKLGVWLRSEIEHKSTLGLKIAERYLAHERRRAARGIGTSTAHAGEGV